eukprot:2819031-Rhodomonas_salina.2
MPGPNHTRRPRRIIEGKSLRSCFFFLQAAENDPLWQKEKNQTCAATHSWTARLSRPLATSLSHQDTC